MLCLTYDLCAWPLIAINNAHIGHPGQVIDRLMCGDWRVLLRGWSRVCMVDVRDDERSPGPGAGSAWTWSNSIHHPTFTQILTYYYYIVVLFIYYCSHTQVILIL